MKDVGSVVSIVGVVAVVVLTVVVSSTAATVVVGMGDDSTDRSVLLDLLGDMRVSPKAKTHSIRKLPTVNGRYRESSWYYLIIYTFDSCWR